MFHRPRFAGYFTIWILFSIACAPDAPVEGDSGSIDRKRPNLVLISLDNLGAGHMSCYGYPRSTTPFMDSLAGKGLLFERAVAQDTWTLPSHVSLLTSRYVGAHGVWNRKRRIPDSGLPQVQEVLREGGYGTAAFTTVLWVSPTYGFDRGMDHFYSEHVPADRLNREVREYLENPPDAPFFLFLHYYDVHTPFREANPYGEDFSAGKDHLDAMKNRLRRLIGKRLVDLTAKDIEGLSATLPGIDVPAVLEGRLDPEIRITRKTVLELCLLHFNRQGREGIAAEEGRYDNGVANMDQRLSELFAWIETRPWFENTIFVITSDHGEAFLEQENLIGHGGLPFEVLSRVPFIVFGTGVPANVRIARSVESIDIAPTLLDWAGLAAPEGFQGRSLVPLIQGGDLREKASISGSLRSGRLSYREGDWKLVWDRKNERAWLFDMTRPDGETINLADKHPRLVEALEAKLLRIERHNQQQGDRLGVEGVSLDEASRRVLEGLGY